MGGPSPTISTPAASMPQQSQQLHKAAPLVVAEGKPPPAKTGAGSSAPTPPPRPAPPEPAGTRPPSPEEAAADAQANAQAKVLALLEERLKSVDQSDPSHDAFVRQLENSARKAVDDNAKIQTDLQRRFLAAKAGANPELFELVKELKRRESALNRNVAEAALLQHLAGGIPREEFPRRIAQIADMRFSANLHQLALATDALAETAGPVSSEQKKGIENIAQKTIDAGNHRDAKWSEAVAASKNGSRAEAKACADGYSKAVREQKDLRKKVEELRRLLAQFDSLAPDAAAKLAQQFHEAQERLLERAAEIRDQLAKAGIAEIAKNDQRKANAESDSEKTALNRREEVGKKKHAFDEQELARAEFRDDLSRLDDTAAENERRAREREDLVADFAKLGVKLSTF